ncbi:MAG: hypothetical protein IJA19_01230 [Clostridia bacterium]|nr:hypothetical protein [Clostridia bacterium]
MAVPFPWQQKFKIDVKGPIGFTPFGKCTYFKDQRSTEHDFQEWGTFSGSKKYDLKTHIIYTGEEFFRWVDSGGVTNDSHTLVDFYVAGNITNLGFRHKGFAQGNYQILEREFRRINREYGIIVILKVNK